MANRKPMLDVETVRDLLTYEPETGKFFWKERPSSRFPHRQACAVWNARFSGKAALCTLAHNGYMYGAIFGENWSTHRIAWLHFHGEEPREVDHINGNRADNRIENLREVDRQANCRNTAKSTRNTSGCVGVRWHKTGRGWNAHIGLKYLGFFKNFDDAVAARKAAEAEKGYHPNHGRSAALN